MGTTGSESKHRPVRCGADELQFAFCARFGRWRLAVRPTRIDGIDAGAARSDAVYRIRAIAANESGLAVRASGSRGLDFLRLASPYSLSAAGSDAVQQHQPVYRPTVRHSAGCRFAERGSSGPESKNRPGTAIWRSNARREPDRNLSDGADYRVRQHAAKRPQYVREPLKSEHVGPECPQSNWRWRRSWWRA